MTRVEIRTIKPEFAGIAYLTVRTSEDGVFWGVLKWWIVTGLLFAFGLPLVVGKLLYPLPDLPNGAREALAAAGLTLIFGVVALINLKRSLGNESPLDVDAPSFLDRAVSRLPHWLRSWLLGLAAVLLGFVISTTIFT